MVERLLLFATPLTFNTGSHIEWILVVYTAGCHVIIHLLFSILAV